MPAANLPAVPDNAGVLVRPPIAWMLTIAAGLALGWVKPLAFLPPSGRALGVVGAGLFAAGFALFAWAALTMRRAQTNLPTNLPTRAIVQAGPYRFTRNPIYVGMFLGLAGVAVGFDDAWLLVGLALFALVIRYGVVAREEAYLARKFGETYLAYRRRVRRWI